jgi:hypothetical protein
LSVARQRGGYDVTFAEHDILDPNLPDLIPEDILSDPCPFTVCD